MIAIVISNDNGKVLARVRRNCRNEPLQGLHPELRKGDRITVDRKTNNPYLVLRQLNH